MTERERLAGLLRSAAEAIERSRAEIDDLNVYPVPDGDTGTNLALTAAAVVEAIESSGSEDRASLARETTRAALMGARGNSGVILSQIVRGAAEALAGEPELDSPAVARAFRAASDAAYRAVRKPVEGTMLTVIREFAAEAERRDDLSLEELFAALVEHGETVVGRTRDQLDVLREAGVVDAGGAGLLELVRGLGSAISGESAPAARLRLAAIGDKGVHAEPSRYRYCTAFVVEGRGLDSEALERELGALGDSLLVVGDASALKIHVHTDDPGRALSLGSAAGVLERVEVANMDRQTAERTERLLGPERDTLDVTDVVAVVAGDGNARLFASLGAGRVVDGGSTMNPSTAELAAAIEAAGADEVVLLPNNENVILAAEQAAAAVAKRVRVVPTRSIPAGLAALVAFDGRRDVEANATEMTAALARVATGAVTVAARDVRLNGSTVEQGAYLGLLEGEPVVAGSTLEVATHALVDRMLAEPREVLTLLVGDGEPQLDGLVEELGRLYPELEIDVQPGGQPHYPLLLSAE